MSTNTGTHGIVPAWTIGDRLRKARELAGFEQIQFAEHIGVDRRTVSNYERDVTSNHKTIYLRARALATGVSLEWLQTGRNPRQDGPDGGLDVRTRRDSNPQPSDPRIATPAAKLSVTAPGGGSRRVGVCPAPGM